MHTTFKEDFKVPDMLRNLYREMEISPIGLLENYALNIVHSKIHKYEAEKMYFEKKYNSTFEKFKQKINKMKNAENFEWEDDLMDWEFAVKNVNYWHKKAIEVRKNGRNIKKI